MINPYLPFEFYFLTFYFVFLNLSLKITPYVIVMFVWYTLVNTLSKFCVAT